MSAEDGMSSEAKAFTQYMRQVQAEYARICSNIIDTAITKYGFPAIIADLEKALKASHKRRTYNVWGEQ